MLCRGAEVATHDGKRLQGAGMCGLFASIGFAPDRARLDIVTHRGPDGSGWDVLECPAGPVALGHRRLSIIDLTEGGHQPMASPDGNWLMIFNGEIYNYLELRDELRAKGEMFVTGSDSEVLLRAYVVWGEQALERLRGMFAVVIWNRRAHTMFAARDRFGIKPLYMLEGQGGLAFASEIKQLLGLPGASSRMNVARVHDFLASGMSDHTAETMFAGIKQLRAGECATVDCRTSVPRTTVKRWYSTAVPVLGLTPAEASARFREALVESVKLHLRSDVKVGSCLSGGLDSSAIVCLMAELMGSRTGGPQPNTVSACYDEKSVDEKPFMEIVVAHANARPHYIYPHADDVFQAASDLTWHQDEPFGSTSIFAQWCVFKKAKEAGIKVMLDGQGADEPLAGYHTSFPYYMAGLVQRGDLGMLLRTIQERKRYHGSSVRDQLQGAVVSMLPARLAPTLRRQRDALINHNWLGTDLIREHGNPKGASALASELLDLPPVVDISTLCLTLTYASNLPMLLHWEDRNSMAHSVEARVPFLDHPLVEFMLGLGNNHKVVGGDTKRVLRAGMEGILPEDVRQRRDKLGFSTPEQVWFRGPLRPLMAEGVETSLRRFPGLMNAKGVRRLADDMLQGRRPVDFTLWRIVNLGIWGERFGVSL